MISLNSPVKTSGPLVFRFKYLKGKSRVLLSHLKRKKWKESIGKMRRKTTASAESSLSIRSYSLARRVYRKVQIGSR